MTRVECLGCGHVLALPPSIPEGGDFACAHCGLQLRNVEAARSFRWRDVDPYVREHGASRLNLLGGMAGAVVWLPILAVVLAVRGQLDGLFLAALGAPSVALLAAFGKKRARTPATAWQAGLWIAIGAYVLYVAALLVARPDWAPLLAGTSGVAATALELGGVGVVCVGAGLASLAVQRRRARRIPWIHGTPPEVP
jgi:hypothetical protein